MPAALQATGPRKPRSVGSGEKSPSNSSPWASADSVAAESAGSADAPVLLTCCLRFQSRTGEERAAQNSLCVIPRSALLYERYDQGTNRVNDRLAESAWPTEVSRRPRRCYEMTSSADCQSQVELECGV